ncbi:MULTISPECIES: hypothetical protein [Aeromicrobium]|nr:MULTISPECIES: hypothetical protein [Aeromicrobium]
MTTPHPEQPAEGPDDPAHTEAPDSSPAEGDDSAEQDPDATSIE